jgi:hypothetical protein
MKSLHWIIIISRCSTSSSSLGYLLKCFKYVSKDKFDSNQVQWTVRSTIWSKVNLIYHLVSWRNGIGPLSSRRWTLSATLARGWDNKDPINVEGLDFLGAPDSIRPGAFGLTKDASTSPASSPTSTF